jgi:hypothetical protein
LQVFADQVCVGLIEEGGAKAVLSFTKRERPIHTIEVRNASGLLIGGFCAQEAGMKTAQFRVDKSVVEVTVHNQEEGGTVRVLRRASTLWGSWLERVPAIGWPRLDREGRGAEPDGSRPGTAWTPAMVALQAGLAVAVTVLAADRLVDRQVQQTPNTAIAPIATDSADKLTSIEQTLARQEALVDKLLQAQGAAMQALLKQQEEVAQVRQTVNAVARAQRRLSTPVVTVKEQTGEAHKASSRKTEAPLRLGMQRPDHPHPSTSMGGKAIPTSLGRAPSRQ